MPDWKEETSKRLAGLRLSPAREVEIVDELAQHLDDRYQELVRGGAGEQEAYKSTLKELAESDVLAHELQRVERAVVPNPIVAGTQRRTNMANDLWQDVRYALRMMVKNPAFTTIAIVALALGIGANSAIFSVVNTVLLQPLPYNDPDRLMMVWEDKAARGFPRDTPSAGNFVDWRDQSQSFEGMAAMADESFNLTGSGDPERIDGKKVSGSFFNLLGVAPQLGRGFLVEEDQPGRNQVVVLSHRLWQRRFAGDPNIVGKTLTLNGQPNQVVGVMPAQFEFPSRDAELWVPIAFTNEQAANRGRHYLQIIGRLKPGVTLQQAQAEMNTIAVRLQQQYPQQNSEQGIAVVPLHEQLVGDIKPALLVLLGAVGFVLLVACANVANLLLARAAGRQKEIALRLALGASRWRLLRQFLTESVLLAAFGGIVGLLLSLVALKVLKGFMPATIAQAQSVSIDARVLLFTLGVSILTGLVFGLAPAVQSSNFNLNESLKEGGRDSSVGARGSRLRGILVVTEVAVSLLLLIGAGLLINSFLRLRSVDPGFKAENLLTMKVVLPRAKYATHQQRSAFYADLVRRVESLPGVTSAGVTTNLPLYRQGNSITVNFAGRPEPPPGQKPAVVTRVISPNYFSTMNIPLLSGRNVNDQDREDGPAVAVINETMARRFWPNQEPVGQRFTPGPVSGPPEAWIAVVGVVKDVRQFELIAEPKPQMYLHYQQVGFFEPNDLVVKTAVDPLSLAGSVRKAVWDIDKDQPVSNIKTMDEILSTSIEKQRFTMLLLGIFAGVALLLAAVGIYGVMSYTLAQRTHEIGIRMALGAQRSHVLKLAVGQGLKLVLVGVAIGLIAAFGLTRLMTSLLFGVRPTDPATLVIISAILISVALLASYIPARRATKVDPLVALRYE